MTGRAEERRPPIAVTGLGLVTSLGVGLEENWKALAGGRSGVRRITRFDTEGLKVTIAATVDRLLEDPSGLRLMHQMSSDVVHEALTQAGLRSNREQAMPLYLGTAPATVAVGELMHLVERWREHGGRGRFSFLSAAEVESDVYARTSPALLGSWLKRDFGFSGSPVLVTTACASGASAIQLAVESIRRGDCRTALAMGSDASVIPDVLARFAALQTLSHANDPPEKASRPFSRDRDGFVMGEGSAALVLEHADHARARGARILGWIRGCGETIDTYHRTRSDPTGGTIARCIQAALDDARVEPDRVDHVNAHGTSTVENDRTEYLGIRQVFGERAHAIPITANKSMLGHSLSAAGAIEAVISIQTMLAGAIPPTINYDIPDPEIPLDVVSGAARAARPRFVLSNSFGFGGQNVSLLFEAAGGDGYLEP